jgi:hypothetical protein
MLTLYITPVIYVYMDRFTHWLDRRKRHRHPAAVLPAPAPQGK